jgi:hypothetical protein
MNGHTAIRCHTIAILSLFLCAPIATTHAQTPAERIARIDREHADSLADLCRELDRALLEALPAWSDPAVRNALFGIPTETERTALKAQADTLASTVSAMLPLVERRIAQADQNNAGGIDQAVQLTEVLIPLARARATLVAAAAAEPPLIPTDETNRAFQQARQIAELAESVSVWSDLERELIIAIASLRLAEADRAVEAVRAARETIREDPTLPEAAPQSVRTLRATETLLVAVARSPSEARQVLPEDPADQDRLRLRIAAIRIRQAQTADTATRLLQAEVDRLANRALDIARSRPFDDGSWQRPILQCDALLTGSNLDALGPTARAATAIARAAKTNQTGDALTDRDLGPLLPLALILQLQSIPPESAASTDIDRLAQIGLDFDRFAAGTPLGDSALERVALLLRARIANPDRPLPTAAPARDRLLDLIDTLTSRQNATRSNLDLLAAVLITPAEPGQQTLGLLERAQTIVRSAKRIEAADADAARAIALTGATLTDALARNQVAALLGQDAIQPTDEAHAITLLGELAPSLRAASGDEGLAVVMQSFALTAPADDLEALRAAQTPLVPDWIIAMLQTRAALLAEADFDTAASDGAVLGAALFIDRDQPQRFDIRTAVPDTSQTAPRAGSALRAADLLITRQGTYTHLAIRALSTALQTDDAARIDRLRQSALKAAPNADGPENRDWLTLLHAEASLRAGNAADAFGVYRNLVATTAPEDRTARPYWHASMRMLEILSSQNADGSRTPAIAREIRRLRLQPSWRTHPDICDRIDAIARDITAGE